MARLPIGQRIRDTRKDRTITQSALAETVGISPSYLNLIEHDKRMIGGALLGRIANALDVDLSRLSGTDDAPLAQNMVELIRSHSLADLTESDALKLVAQNPDWAHTVIDLHRRYQDVSETAMALSDRLSQDPTLMELSHAVLTQITSIRSFAEILEDIDDLKTDDQKRFAGIIADQSDRLGSSARAMIDLLSGPTDTVQSSSPEKEVDDFIIRNNNYFQVIEDAVEELHKDLFGDEETSEIGIADVLVRKHKVDVPSRSLEILPQTSIRFRRARQLISLELGGLFDRLTGDERLSSAQSRDRARIALANYGAGALLFPYRLFLHEAEAARYDIEYLCLRFRGSFEQICHRVGTLRREGEEGIPFAFLRADPAGNLSKPFSSAGLPMPRLGSACPLWAIYEASSIPDRTIAQYVEVPGGERYLFIARHLKKRNASSSAGQVSFSIMLGCDVAYADRIAYADRVMGGRAASPLLVGFTCRSCNREGCGQRAQPAVRANVG